MHFKDLDISTKIILKVIIAGLLLWFLWVIRDIIVMLVLALILASAMEPMVEYFNRKRGIPRAVSVLGVYVLVLGLVAVVVALVMPPVLIQFKVISANLPDISLAIQERFGSLLGGASISKLISETISTIGNGHSIVSGTFGVFNGLFTAITVLVVSFYLVAEERGMKKFIGALIPEHHHEFAGGLVEKIQKKMGLWIIGQVILSVAIFSITWIGLSVLGIKYALILALLAGLLEIVPYIGPFVSAVPAIIFAYIQNPALALVVGILYLLIQKTEGYILVPKVMEKTVGTSPLVVLIALLVGFKLSGIIGLLIAVPLVGAFTVAINEFWPNSGLQPVKQTDIQRIA